jgi:hypothetical protein
MATAPPAPTHPVGRNVEQPGTGADSGIGRAVAIAYAREGADVLIAQMTPSSRSPIHFIGPNPPLPLA